MAKPNIDWGSYGLSTEADPLCPNPSQRNKDLFQEDQVSGSRAWWKTHFFIREPVVFGTWDGAFTSCLINFISVIVFLRVGWVVGNAGIDQSVVLVLVTVFVCTTTILSAIAICDRANIENGGVHSVLSHVLGVRIGGSVSLIYCFGQAVSCSLHVMGFSDSMAEVLRVDNPWLKRGIAVTLGGLLFGINVAGVKWVIRLQLILLLVVACGIFDFGFGTIFSPIHEPGFQGYSAALFHNNTGPSYTQGENWFSVLGIFFPTMTGVLAGVNMAADLKTPSKSIPKGTLSAIFTGLVVYLIFVLGLGSTCTRAALLSDYFIVEKVALLKVPVLAALYISSMSTSLAALYATPRIIQAMAHDMPFLKRLQAGIGPNKVPIYALVIFLVFVLCFIAVGQINILAPLVTVPFMLTYAAVEYAYFSLAMSYDLVQIRDIGYGATSTKQSDMDQLFHQKSPGSVSPLTSPDEHSSVRSVESNKSSVGLPELESTPITTKSSSFWLRIWNRWAALFGCVLKLVLMFLVQWGYSLLLCGAVVATWIYIGHVNPGTPPGVSEFRLLPWLKNVFFRCLGCKPVDYERIVVAPVHPGVQVLASQLTQENADYASREKFHHSTNVTADFDSD